jgi:hypothetical protein
MRGKDFRLLAGAIRRSEIGSTARLIVAAEIAAALAGTYPTFEPSRFIRDATGSVENG